MPPFFGRVNNWPRGFQSCSNLIILTVPNIGYLFLSACLFYFLLDHLISLFCCCFKNYTCFYFVLIWEVQKIIE